MSAPPSLLSTIPEREWLQQVRDLAGLLGWAVYHTHLSLHSPEGFPDLVLARPPRLIFAELKREVGKPTAAQLAWLGTLSRCRSVETYLWRPSDLDYVRKVLARARP